LPHKKQTILIKQQLSSKEKKTMSHPLLKDLVALSHKAELALLQARVDGLNEAKNIAWKEYKDGGKAQAAFNIHHHLLELARNAEIDLRETTKRQQVVDHSFF
jgi:hypothetical protein